MTSSFDFQLGQSSGMSDLDMKYSSFLNFYNTCARSFHHMYFVASWLCFPEQFLFLNVGNYSRLGQI